MIRQSELMTQHRARETYEAERPGMTWRDAGLMDRQNMLARIRDEMRAEGIVTEADEGEAVETT